MQVRFTRQAIADLKSAKEHIFTDSPGNAALVIERIENAVDTICRYPDIGRNGRVKGTREFVVLQTPFIVVYRVLTDALQIITILHSARRPWAPPKPAGEPVPRTPDL